MILLVPSKVVAAKEVIVLRVRRRRVRRRKTVRRVRDLFSKIYQLSKRRINSDLELNLVLNQLRRRKKILVQGGVSDLLQDQ